MIKNYNNPGLPGLDEDCPKAPYIDHSVSAGYWVKSVPIRSRKETSVPVFRHTIMLGEKPCEKPENGAYGFRRLRALAELLNTKRTADTNPGHDRQYPAAEGELSGLTEMPRTSNQRHTQALFNG